MAGRFRLERPTRSAGRRRESAEHDLVPGLEGIRADAGDLFNLSGHGGQSLEIIRYS